MLSNDAVRHEEAETSAALLGREVRLEQPVALVFRDTGAVVRDAEVRPSVSPPASGCLNPTALVDSIDGVVQQVGDYLAHQQRVCAHVDDVRRLASCELDFLGPRSRPSHPETE